MRVINVRNLTRGTVIGNSVLVAETSLSRVVGLLGRAGIDRDSGLLIAPSSGVHTIGMRFTIDAVGLDAHSRVVRLWPQLKPFRLTAVSLKVRSVLELAAGHIAATGIRLGDELQMNPPAPTP